MKMRTLGTLLVLPLIAAAAPAVRSNMLVSTGWLANHLNDPNMVIVEVSRDRTEYDAGHIPGARFLALSEIAVKRDGLLNELPPAAALESLFERLGVSDGTRVILYGDASVLPATRAYFTLDYMGHGDAAALLDGGLPKWKAESRPLSKDAPQEKQGHLTLRLHPEIVVHYNAAKDLSYAATNGQAGSASLVDARAAADFHGTTAANAEIPRPGHIPGAANLFWMETQTSKSDMTLLPEAELRKMYESVGVTPDRPVVTYCNTGMQASQSYFALKYLGYDARMYDGSFSEWSAVKDSEVQK
ncbi:MAG TPA: sulfurtransferase [Bryobacteraceae bacterium]|nr:sulfurtransferase [Bryobacteraceae bacterium]